MPLLRRADSVLAVVDTQPGFVDQEAMRDEERAAAAATVLRIAWLARLAALLAIPAVVTEERPEREGATDARVAQCLPDGAPVVAKATFALTGCRDAMAALERSGRRSVVVVGFETDVCVAQSAVGLADAGYRVVVPADAACSGSEEDHGRGIARMRAEGVDLHSTKSVTYEWLEDVETAAEVLARARTGFDALPLRL